MLLTAHAKPDTEFGSVLLLHNITATQVMNLEGTGRCPLACMKGQHKQQCSGNQDWKARSASPFGRHAMGWVCSLASKGTLDDCARSELNEINPTLGKSKAFSGLPSLWLMTRGGLCCKCSVLFSSTWFPMFCPGCSTCKQYIPPQICPVQMLCFIVHRSAIYKQPVTSAIDRILF